MPTIEVDGANIAYEVIGDSDAPTIAHLGWDVIEPSRAFAEELVKCDCRVLLWDRPGLGGSDFDFAAPSFFEMAADALAHLFDHLGVTKGIVSGCSSACAITLEFQ